MGSSRYLPALTSRPHLPGRPFELVKIVGRTFERARAQRAAQSRTDPRAGRSGKNPGDDKLRTRAEERHAKLCSGIRIWICKIPVPHRIHRQPDIACDERILVVAEVPAP